MRFWSVGETQLMSVGKTRNGSCVDRKRRPEEETRACDVCSSFAAPSPSSFFFLLKIIFITTGFSIATTWRVDSAA